MENNKEIIPNECENNLHEFDGHYHIRARNMTVEMNCIKCGKLCSWDIDYFENMIKND